MNKQERYKSILYAAEVRFERGEAATWKNKDYEDLSKNIWEKTHVLISTATLKRMFGKVQTKEDYYPQESTLDALMLYADFRPEAKNSDKQFIISTPQILAADSNSQPLQLVTKHPILQKKYVALLLIVMVMVAAVLYFNKNNPSTPPKTKLSLDKKEGDAPATVFFSIDDISQIQDSVFFDRGDYTAPLYVDREKTKITVYYPNPGVYYTKLFTKKQVISDTVTCVLRTKGWRAYLSDFKRQYQQLFTTIPAGKNKDSSFYVTGNYLYNTLRLDTTKLLVTHLMNIAPTTEDGDNWEANLVFKNPITRPSIICCGSNIEILGSNSKLHFSFAFPGCSFWITSELSEKKLTINDFDFSKFTTDLSEWQNIKIINKNKYITLILNGNIAFEGHYQKPLGNISGLYFHCNGYGSVKSASLKNAQNPKPIFLY
jgi:hypothetical protein